MERERAKPTNRPIPRKDKAAARVAEIIAASGRDEIDLLEELRKHGMPAKAALEILKQRQKGEAGRRAIEIPGNSPSFEIGVVSDTHLCAKTCALDELHAMYDIFERRGVKHVLHDGDLADGNGKVYQGQLNELKVWGLDDSLEYVAKNYPKRKGITTHFIGGNHDESWLKTDGANFGKLLAEKRPDMDYLGMYDAMLDINGVKFQLHHGAGGGAYALTYKIQKYVENLTGEDKPDVFLLGHYHTAVYASIRHIHSFTAGCWQWPNDFSKRLLLPNVVGGWLIGVDKNKEGKVRGVRSEFKQFFKP